MGKIAGVFLRVLFAGTLLTIGLDVLLIGGDNESPITRIIASVIFIGLGTSSVWILSFPRGHREESDELSDSQK